ncbi:hypothetical protein DICPUDRAFT_147065 [Dictyostelium purpureum]|uniref:Uncharacterized protein n=1 Tax=Dictyostelium purpureum TaxID=5786 RepID=F0Z7K3_DICPU|nr:uncharacterized protein DICPUDRAFT_147065 [Dictyostelium purpureum]EGC40076.1 hypothetical protein DICPUDRAFT_147065 [Dictyostelium purpureum]|eukprot:XP_003283425.1 hypothetical protein DICPUDRAFT_147065 [Dictyostelium purpureum]
MIKKYEIPIDTTGCCYSVRSEILEKPSKVPEELSNWTILTIEDLNEIVIVCNTYFRKKKIANIVYLIFPVSVLYKNFDKNIQKLNEKYTCKGVIIKTNEYIGFGKNKRMVTRIHLEYDEDWYRHPNSLYNYQTQKNEIVLPPSHHNQPPEYFINQISSSTVPINVNNTISLEKVNNNTIQNNNVNNLNINQYSRQYNHEDIPIDVESSSQKR